MRKQFILIQFVFLSLVALAQGSIDDYNRAFSYPDRVKDKVFYSNVLPHWINPTEFWYIQYTPTGKIYTLIDAKSKTRKLLFDHMSLNEKLNEMSKQNLTVDQYSLKG